MKYDKERETTIIFLHVFLIDNLEESLADPGMVEWLKENPDKLKLDLEGMDRVINQIDNTETDNQRLIETGEKLRGLASAWKAKLLGTQS